MKKSRPHFWNSHSKRDLFEPQILIRLIVHRIPPRIPSNNASNPLSFCVQSSFKQKFYHPISWFSEFDYISRTREFHKFFEKVEKKTFENFKLHVSSAEIIEVHCFYFS